MQILESRGGEYSPRLFPFTNNASHFGKKQNNRMVDDLEGARDF
jgi:hypothetical protein